MELPKAKTASLEIALSLQHIFRVARAVNVDPLRGIEAAVAYITEERSVNLVAETWIRAFDEVPPPLGIVLVSALPRGARVEWHVIRCRKKTSDEHAACGFRMVFDDDDDGISVAVAELRGEHGVLCMRFGSPLSDKLNTLEMAVQEIPSKAIYSAGKQISTHTACTVIQTG